MPFNFIEHNPWGDDPVLGDEPFDFTQHDPWEDTPIEEPRQIEPTEVFDFTQHDPWQDDVVEDRYTTYNDLMGKDGYVAQAVDRGEISIGKEDDDRPGHFWQGLGTFVSQFPSIVTDVIPMTVYRAARRGKDVTLEDETSIDRLIRKNIQERAKYKTLSEEERQKKWFRANIPFTNIGIDINLAQAEDVADSLGYSVVNAFATLLGRAVGRGVGVVTGPAAPAATPALGVAAGFASGYYVASGATRDEFVERARDAYLKEVGGKITPETEAGWQARYKMIKSDADWTGFWEAAPETVGNLLMFGIAKLPIKGAVAKIGLAGAVNKLKNEAVRKIGKELINKVGIPAAKLMGMLTEETFTEALTTMKQSEIEYKNDMRDKPLSYLESIVEVLPTVLLTTPILGLGMGGAVKILEKTTGKIVEEKDKGKLTKFVDEMVAKLPREEVAIIREQTLRADPKHPIIALIDKAVKTIPPPLPLAKKVLPVKEVSPEVEVLEKGRLARRESVIKTLEVADQEAVRVLGREHGLTDAEMDDRSIDQVIAMVADRVAGITAPVVEGQGGGIDVLETIISGIDKTFETGTVTEAPADATRTQAQKLMSAMGGQLTFFEETGESILSTFNGFHDPKSKRIFINAKAKNPVLRVLGHEAWHRLKGIHSDLYENVKAVAEANEKVFIDFIVKLNAKRKGIGFKSLKINDLTEEYLADFAGEMFAKASFWKAINKSNPTFARKIANSLRKIIQDFRRIIAAKPELKKIKQPFENMDQVEKAMSEAFGEAFVREAAPVEAKKEPVEISKEKPKAKPLAKEVPSKIRTIRGAIKSMGGINFLQFTGELKEMDTAVKYLSKKDGLPIDIMEKALKDDKWLYSEESLLEVLRDSKNLKRDRVTVDLLEKREHELSEQERRAKKEMKREPEAPPEGEYKTIRAEDLPEGKKLTIIEGKSAEGWDIYVVKEKDPFSITLVDGQEIELKPLDKVQVLKAKKILPAKEPAKMAVEVKTKQIQEFKETEFKDSDEIMSFIESNFHDKVVTKPGKEPKISFSMKTLPEITETENGKKMIAAAIKVMGTTNDLMEAGYILPNGKLLDFSGKKEGGTPGMRSLDHRDIGIIDDPESGGDETIKDFEGGTDGMLQFMSETGAVRFGIYGRPGERNAVVHVMNKLTDAQKRIISKAVKESGGDIDIDVYEKWTEPTQYLGSLWTQSFYVARPGEVIKFIESGEAKVKEPKLEISAYHGTGTVFEEFDTGYIGTGEGATAFGWGLYFSSIENIGKHYARGMGKHGAGLSIRGRTFYETETLPWLKEISNVLNDKELSNQEKALRIRGIAYEHSPVKGDTITAMAVHELSNIAAKEIKDGALVFLKSGRQLYKVILHKGKEPGDYEWLDWYDEISKDTISALNKQWKAEGREPYSGLSGLSGNNLYEILTKIEESKKEASLFLLRAGIDGIRYPTETLSGRLGKGFNYVVFDADAISIEDRVSFSLKGPELSPIGKQYMDAFLGKQGKEAPVARSRIRGLLYPWKYVTGKSLATGETIGEILIRKMQDKYIHLKKLQKRLSPTTQLEDKIDVYLSEEILSGRTTWQLDQFENNYVKPFLDKMLELGIDVKDLDLYVYAAHAPERNDNIDKKNPDFREKGIPGSGMHTEVANTIIKKYKEKGMLRKLEGLAKILYKINGARIKLLLNAGLITKETHDAVLGTYKRYVPLRGKEGEPDFMGSGRGFSIPSTGLQRALGRKSFAQSPLAWSLGAVEETIVKINKNEVGKSLLGLIREFPDKDLWTIDEITTKQKWDPEKGEVETVRVPAWAQKDILHVWENGKRRNVKIKDPLLEKALLNIGSEKMGSVVAALAKFNRYLAMVNTSLNPEFVLTNFARDIQTAGINLSADQSSKLMRKVMKDVPRALRHAYRGYRGKPGIGDWGKWFKLYRSSGGSIGFFGLRGVDDKIKTIDAMIKRTKKGVLPAARRGVSEVTGFISDVNSAVENAVRMASFKNAVESGLTPARAASLSKNLTVNFNRKGELGALMNSFYLFYNAGVQGTARVLQVMTSKTGRRIGAGIAATAFMMTELNRMAGGDDEEDGRNYYDKIPNYVKERSIILMIPGTDGDYIKFPLPYGYNIFWVMGEQTNSALHSGKPVQGAINVLNAAVDAFNPMGGDSSLIRTLSPTLPDVLLDLYMNQNFAGYPIKPEQSQFGLPKPQSWLYWRSVSPISKYIAQKVNKITGGNPIRPGKIDVSPEVLDYLVGTFTGAAGAFINRSLNLGIDLLTGKERAIHKTPFQRVFMGEQTEFYTGGEYRKVAEEIKRRIEEKEEGLPAVAPELSSELKSRYKATEKNLRAVRKRIKDIERSQLSAKRKKELVKEKREEMSFRQKDLIKRFDKEIGGSPWEMIDILNLRKARKKANG